MTNKKFATVINCMDGRTQLPVNAWLQATLTDAAFIDTITVPGPDGMLTTGSPEKLAELLSYVKISTEKHGSEVVAVVGHHDCAGNPVSREAHLQDIQQAVAVIAGWQVASRVIGLWVNEHWQVELIADTNPTG
jgi:carbonic anhydrase